MRRHHRLTFWSIAGVHLLVAVLTYRAGVPVASPVVLAVVALVAFGLGFTRPARTDENRHPLLGRADAGAALRSTTRDQSGEPGPGATGEPDPAIGDPRQDDEQTGEDKGAA